MSTTPTVSTGGLPAQLTSASACTTWGRLVRLGGARRAAGGVGAARRRGGAAAGRAGGGSRDGGGADGARAAASAAAWLGRQPGEPVQDLLAGPQVAGEPGAGAGEVLAGGVLAGGVHREVEGGRDVLDGPDWDRQVDVHRTVGPEPGEHGSRPDYPGPMRPAAPVRHGGTCVRRRTQRSPRQG